MANVANVVPRGQETVNTTSRVTKEGRRLSYQLTVIQQPERARACGSGAKSSADRRPVDPPPIVGLRVFEGEEGAMQDITFSYKANFFLFATLESARPIAQGRVPQTTPAFPVLTGMFVSGMAYLDRPVPAGYFLFPDLSVRHEGKYRLSFNLYEETKDAKDADADPSEQARAARARARLPGPHAPQAFVDWRLEVKSKPFIVYSAKKFPGLAESTSLSRIVAEQGCRVRIRRDVRMRRRGDAKPAPSAHFDEPDDEEDDEIDADELDHESPADRAVHGPPTPGPDSYRRADGSNSNMDLSRHMPAVAHAREPVTAAIPPPPPPPPAASAAPYGLDGGARRQSMAEGTPYGPPSASYPRSYPAPPVMPHHAPDPYATVMDAPTAASAYHQAPPPHHHHHHPYATGSHAPPPPPPPSSHPAMSYVPAPQVQRYPVQPAMASPHSRHDSLDHVSASRRPSMSGAHASMSSVSSGGAVYGYPEAGPVRPPSVMGRPYGASTAAALRRTPTPGSNEHPLPPLNVAVAVEPRYASATSSAATVSAMHSAPHPPSASSDTSSYPPASATTTDSGRPTKRPYGIVFDASQFDASLRDGMRPSEAAHGAEPLLAADDDEDAVAEAHDMLRLRMQYKRADGTEISRRPPSNG